MFRGITDSPACRACAEATAADDPRAGIRTAYRWTARRRVRVAETRQVGQPRKTAAALGGCEELVKRALQARRSSSLPRTDGALHPFAGPFGGIPQRGWTPGHDCARRPQRVRRAQCGVTVSRPGEASAATDGSARQRAGTRRIRWLRRHRSRCLADSGRAPPARDHTYKARPRCAEPEGPAVWSARAAPTAQRTALRAATGWRCRGRGPWARPWAGSVRTNPPRADGHRANLRPPDASMPHPP
jgi:hypothetical protein